MPDTIYNKGSYWELLVDAVRFSRIAFTEHRRSDGVVPPSRLVMHPADARVYARAVGGINANNIPHLLVTVGRVSAGRVDGIELILDSRVDLGKFFLE